MPKAKLVSLYPMSRTGPAKQDSSVKGFAVWLLNVSGHDESAPLL